MSHNANFANKAQMAIYVAASLSVLMQNSSCWHIPIDISAVFELETIQLPKSFTTAQLDAALRPLRAEGIISGVLDKIEITIQILTNQLIHQSKAVELDTHTTPQRDKRGCLYQECQELNLAATTAEGRMTTSGRMRFKGKAVSVRSVWTTSCP